MQCGCPPRQQGCNCQLIQQQSDACGCGPLQYTVSCNKCQSEQPSYLVVQPQQQCVPQCMPSCDSKCISAICQPACQPMCDPGCMQQQRAQIIVIPTQQQASSLLFLNNPFRLKCLRSAVSSNLSTNGMF